MFFDYRCEKSTFNTKNQRLVLQIAYFDTKTFNIANFMNSGT